MICTLDDFPLKIIPYQGRNEEKDAQLSQRVISLSDVVNNIADHSVYIDNFFSSHTLFVVLKERGYFVTQTV